MLRTVSANYPILDVAGYLSGSEQPAELGAQAAGGQADRHATHHEDVGDQLSRVW